MNQTLFLSQLRVIILVGISFAAGKGWLSSADSGVITSILTPLGVIAGPWIWSIYSNINSKIVPQHALVIDPVVTTANAGNATATVNTEAGTVTGKVVGVLALLILGALAFPGDAMAQLKPLTGNIRNDLGISRPSGQAGAAPLQDLLGALDDKLLPDLQYALKIATASSNDITAPCWQAWIDIIQTRQKAVTNADGTPMDLPNPRLITDFEKAIELRNALQPESKFMRMCSPVANMIKQDVIAFIGKVLAGGAGLAMLGL